MTDKLLDVDAAKALLAGNDNDVTLIQVTSEATYAQAHLPGAVLVTPAELVSGEPPATGKLPSLTRLQQLFQRLGHHSGRHYLVVDDEGGGWAGRFIWTLDIIGHHRWSYLDGGMHAWNAAGEPFSAEPVEPTPLDSPPELDLDYTPLAKYDEIIARLGEDDLVIWDVRSYDEYTGARPAAARSGHIPGAVHLDWDSLKDPARDMRLVSNLGELLGRHGITADKEIITHCQTHHRSGLSYLVGRLLGFPRIRAYHGSWSEWGNRDDTPIEQ